MKHNEEIEVVVIKLLEQYGYKPHIDKTRHLLLLILSSVYKVKTVQEDLSNESLGELIIIEWNRYLISNFGVSNARNIVKAIFLAIVRHHMFIDGRDDL